MIAAIVVSWARFITFFLVIQSVSKLIMTLADMVSSMMTFILMIAFYFVMVSPFYEQIFQTETIQAENSFFIYRGMVDNLFGVFFFIEKPTYKYLWQFFILLNVLLANVFLLNYLVAILSTTYGQSEEQGDFAYKQNKYKYIERFSNAMKDENGYSELVVLPPPVNFLIILLMPAMIKKQNMQRSSATFSKFIFWLENIIYVLALLMYELILVPIIYFALIVRIVKASPNFFAIPLVIGWALCGLFYLLYCVCLDIFNFLKILVDYKEEGDENTIKDLEDELQDKIVIYNEVIDTLRAIMNIFRYHQTKSELKKKQERNKNNKWYNKSKSTAETVHQEFGIVKQQPKGADKNFNPLLVTSNQYDLLEELQREKDEHEDEEGYTIDKNLILQAWKRFRPVNKQESDIPRTPRTKQNNIEQIFGEHFTRRLMSNIHLRLYNF